MLCYRNTSFKIRNTFRFNDQIPIYMNSDLIYKYKCNISNHAYIGEIKRHIFVCQYEHLGRSILTEKPLKYNEKDATAVRKHCHKQNLFLFLDWKCRKIITTSN